VVFRYVVPILEYSTGHPRCLECLNEGFDLPWDPALHSIQHHLAWEYSIAVVWTKKKIGNNNLRWGKKKKKLERL
jgi:uncharacterized membrane protein YagU involved in acid resistance